MASLNYQLRLSRCLRMQEGTEENTAQSSAQTEIALLLASDCTSALFRDTVINAFLDPLRHQPPRSQQRTVRAEDDSADIIDVSEHVTRGPWLRPRA